MGIFTRDYVGELKWESIKNTGDGRPQYSSRAKVFGGWLVSIMGNASIGGNGATFIPNPEHKWILKPCQK
ncbi:hypothetical protein [Candidatus Thiodubiliella endoseptemdiera]|uniref:Uncharacterized protein n=1 Tax=Candidatus Thiodubiliella endoseptemdiera TaxID=2738886 RepID=A0A853EZ65_9GAMM|nr:hypothetical protein [Candidatus Thiodubiliella endoseptemdiera]